MASRIGTARLAGLLAFALVGTGLTLALLVLRVRHTGLLHFGFLAWNLMLAWIPMVLALVILGLHRARTHGAVLGAVAVPWLLFLPNAPYVATDVIHLQTAWGGVPWWFDTVLVGAAAGTGMLLGYSALLVVQVVATQRYGSLVGWAVALGSLGLSGVGIYLGRFLRFNSWDVVADPGIFVSIATRRFEDPFANDFLLAAVAGFAIALVVGYLVFLAATSTLESGSRRVPAR
ncbi:MAG: DUF1361 domain-containing protein [Dehalococcoidia bacterium]|nr:DUF1361 domain-containing protein [Dehalococcoidia bacterium]